MKFTDFDKKIQDDVIQLFNQHVVAAADIIKKDGELLPMLMIPDTKQLVSLQPADGNTDVDKAYACAIEKLKQQTFSYALFSYSTQLGLATGQVCDALKTLIFTADGTEFCFFTPYVRKGLFKKTLTLGKTVLGEISQNVFDQQA